MFGIAAAYSVSWSKLASTLHAGDVRSAGSVKHRIGRHVLVAAEVALSLMLLIGAALLTQSFMALSNVRPGFDARRVLTAQIGVPIGGRFDPAADGPRWSALLNQVTARVGALPGVVAAGAVSSLPLSGGWESGGVRVPGVTYQAGQAPSAQYNIVSGDYFEAAGITVRAGRAFDSSDDAADGRASIIVSSELARSLFGSDADAVGRELQVTFEFTRNPPPRTIVGVVDDVKQMSMEDAAQPQVYVPQSQMSYPGLALVVRAAGNPTPLVDAVKRAVRAVDPTLTIDKIQPMERVVSQSLARQRFSMTLIGVFAGLAVALAIVGLYGVIALIVGQRRREIGVRLALGASQGDVVRMILGEGARVTTLGVLLGIAGAMALTRLLTTMLFGISTTDVWTFAGAALLVALVAMGASYAPARRAARVDPKAALIAE
jgi:predicted permease